MSDPATRYASDLHALVASAGALLGADAMRVAWPHIEALARALPDSVPAPRLPRPAPRVETVGTDREATTG